MFLIILILVKLSFISTEKSEVYFDYDHTAHLTDSIKFNVSPEQTVRQVNRNTIPYNKVSSPKIPLVHLNLADSFAFQKLPGIGEVYASRIVRYRNLLGGYYEHQQLLEVYGIDSALYEDIVLYLVMEDVRLRKINVNTCSVKDLYAHPYVTYSLAKLIVKYRSHHGPYSSLDDLRDLPLLDERLFRKIVRYLELE